MSGDVAPAVRHARREPHAGEEKHRRRLGLGLVAAVGAVLVLGLVDLPRGAAALPDIARHAMRTAIPQWGQTNVVNAVVYGARGFDTFGETFLLLAAIVSVTTLTRSRERRRHYLGEAVAGRGAEQQQGGDGDGGDSGGADASGHRGSASGDGGGQESQARAAEQAESGAARTPPHDADRDPLGTPAPERAAAMTVVVRVSAKIAAVVLSVAAVYLAAWGYTPGSGFPTGAALAGVVVLLYAAFGYQAIRRAVRPDVLEPVEVLGGLMVVGVGLGGLIAHGSLFANWIGLAEPATLLAGGNNRLFAGGELVAVSAGLVIATFALLGMRHDWARDETDDGVEGGGDGDDGSRAGEPA